MCVVSSPKALVALNGFLVVVCLATLLGVWFGRPVGSRGPLIEAASRNPRPRSEKSQSGPIGATHQWSGWFLDKQEYLMSILSRSIIAASLLGSVALPALAQSPSVGNATSAPATHETRNVATDATAPSQRNTALT